MVSGKACGMVAAGYGESVRDQVAIGFKALVPASVAALVLGAAVYLIEGSVLGAIVVAVAVVVMLSLMLGFPELVNRPLWGKLQPQSRRIRRSLIRLTAFGALVLVAGLLLDSTVLLLVGVGWFGYWYLVFIMSRRHG
jgi:hypothetical protein